MIDDDVLREVRAAREAYARSHHFDVRAMIADLQARDAAGDWPIVRRAPRPPQPVAPGANRALNPAEQSTGAA